MRRDDVRIYLDFGGATCEAEALVWSIEIYTKLMRPKVSKCFFYSHREHAETGRDTLSKGFREKLLRGMAQTLASRDLPLPYG